MNITKILISLSLIISVKSFAMDFEKYLSSFNYQERVRMKIKPADLLALYSDHKVQIVDIRFKEEFELWHFDGSLNIPLNELPNRLGELDKNKLVVTVCPHVDWASIARVYLTLKGFNAKYLTGGLLKLFESSRGDKAKNIILKRQKGRK